MLISICIFISNTCLLRFSIVEGCLQSVYGIHTFRIESIAHGIAAPVDELQVQGVSNPELLRKVNSNNIFNTCIRNDMGSKSKIYRFGN